MFDMSTDPDLQDQAYMKLGRLIHSYQKFEKLLKVVVAQSNVYGTKDELEKNFKKLQAATSGQTLGSITNRLFDTIYGSPKEVPEPASYEQPFISMGIRVVVEGPEVLVQKRKQFQAVVVDRNTLIHCTLTTLDFESETDCQILINELDRQLEKLRPVYKEIQYLLRHSIQFTQAVAANPSLFDPNAKQPDSIKIGSHIFTQESSLLYQQD